MTTTGEMSGTQAVDFSSLGHDFFPAGSAQRLWLDAYAKGVDRFSERSTHTRTTYHVKISPTLFRVGS
jgi:hypothetical protein